VQATCEIVSITTLLLRDSVQGALKEVKDALKEVKGALKDVKDVFTDVKDAFQDVTLKIRDRVCIDSFLSLFLSEYFEKGSLF